MIKALILVVSLVTLSQFFVSYCRSLVVAYSKVELSPRARQLAELDSRDATGDEFPRLVQLVRLCPEPADDRLELRAVHAYYSLLSLMRGVLFFAPPVMTWADRERAACAHFAAVALDRRVACNCDGMT